MRTVRWDSWGIAGYAMLLFLSVSPASEVISQTIVVNGNIHTTTSLVRNASVTFIDKADTSKKYSAMSDSSGNFQLSIVTGILDPRSTLPRTIELAPNYPNPFTTITAIPYTLNKQSDVSIIIFDLLGREVKRFPLETEVSGSHSVLWDGRDAVGRKLAAGIYFYQLRVGNETQTRKMALTTGVVSTNPSPSSARTSKGAGLKKTRTAQASPGIYTVQIRNTDITVPQISTREYYAVTIQEDTTMSFAVAEATHYNMNLFLGSRGYDQVYVIDVDTDTIIDTLTGFSSVVDATPTRSGKKLYVTKKGGINAPGTVYSVDLQSKTSTPILAKSADVYIEPNGTPLILISSPYDSIRQVGIIDTLTDEIRVIDSLDIYTPTSGYGVVAFHPSSPSLYTWTSQMKFFGYDYQDRKILQYYHNVGAIKHLLFSPDGRDLYFAGGPILDVMIDSVVGWVGAGYGQTERGNLALSSDGLYLYITDPANYIIPEPVPSGLIGIFNTTVESLIGSIDVNRANGYYSTLTDRILLLPDGKKGYVNSFANMFVLDLETNSVVNVVRFQPLNIQLSSITAAPK